MRERGNGKARAAAVVEATTVLEQYVERIGNMYRASTLRVANMLAQGVVDAGLLPRAKGTGGVEIRTESMGDKLVVTATCRIVIAQPRED